VAQSTYSKGHIITTQSESNSEYGVSQSPFGLNTGIRRSCVPRGSSTGQTWLKKIAPCIEMAQAFEMSFAKSGETYVPTMTSASIPRSYTEIVSASNPNNSSALQVGSLYLEDQTYITIGALFTDIKAGVGGTDVHVEFKRFTTGVSLVTLSNTNTAGPTWEFVTASNVVVSDSDWYDIYISSSAAAQATSSIRGVYYEY
jgi:hypothetical protein